MKDRPKAWGAAEGCGYAIALVISSSYKHHAGADGSYICNGHGTENY